MSIFKKEHFMVVEYSKLLDVLDILENLKVEVYEMYKIPQMGLTDRWYVNFRAKDTKFNAIENAICEDSEIRELCVLW